MRRIQAICNVIMLGMMCSGISSAGELNQYAILDFSVSGGVKQSDATAMAERYASQLKDSKGLSVLPCSEVRNTLKVNRWNAAEYTTLQLAAQAAGQILKAQYVVFGSVRQVGDVHSMEATILDVKANKGIRTATTDIKGGIGDLLEKGVALNIEKLLGSPAPKPELEKAAGTAAVADRQAVATPVEKGGDDPSWMRRNWKWVAGGVGGAAVIGAVAAGGGGGDESSIYDGTWVGDGGGFTMNIINGRGTLEWRWDGNWIGSRPVSVFNNQIVQELNWDSGESEYLHVVFSSSSTGEVWLDKTRTSHVEIRKQ